jgi:Transposase DDE domain
VKVARRVRREATRKRTPPGHLAARPTLPDDGDGFCEPGFSKERRLEPQITVGLLTDARGFPLQVHAFEGNTAETKTILPVLEAFMAAHRLPEVTVVADAGMLSEANLAAIEDAGLRFIVGARIPDIPYQVTEWRRRHPDQPISDGQVFTQPSIMGGKADPRRRTIFYQYRANRARRTLKGIDQQIVSGEGGRRADPGEAESVRPTHRRHQDHQP